MCVFSFCIDIFSKNDHEYSKEKSSTNKKSTCFLAKLKEECRQNFDGELEAKS